MSCGTSLDDDTIWQAAKGRNQSDYFVFVMTGTDDFAYSYDKTRTADMAKSSYFTNIDQEADGNMAFRVKEGYFHDETAAMEYTFNGLKAFFGVNRSRKSDSSSSADFNSSTASESSSEALESSTSASNAQTSGYSRTSKIEDVINDSAFKGHGRLLFPADDGYWSGDTLENLRLTWYNDIDPDTTVDIVNTLKTNAESGKTIFYDIYTDEEKAADPAKEDTGLFFFQGNPGAKTAIVNAGGGFAFVGAMQDSFPHALALSKKGYNAFALIYRPGAETACEDLSRAVAFLSDHAKELNIDMTDYSLWGGSAGARMAAWVGTYGTAEFGEKEYPKPAAVIMQYTGLSEVTGEEPPTYACVGTSDGIASYRTMQRRISAIRANGTNAEIEVFKGLLHGFGLGTGTVAEGWIDHAVKFWRDNM